LATDAKTPSLYTGYFGISRTGGSMIFNPQPVNMVTGQLLLSIKPLPDLQIAASSFAFARIIAGAKGNVTESGILTNNEENFLGFEQDVSALLRPASDWGSNLGMAVFVPNEKAGSRKMEYKVSAGLNLSF
jgi:hypothetical protein